MTTFKVGDKVRFNDSHTARTALKWRRDAGYPTIHGGDVFTVVKVYGEPFNTLWIKGTGLADETWEQAAFSLVNSYSRSPTLGGDLRLYPQDRLVLSYLKAGKPITPMKALVVYGISRLAACVYNIRRAGYNVAKTMETDESGHKYASYKLVNTVIQ